MVTSKTTVLSQNLPKFRFTSDYAFQVGDMLVVNEYYRGLVIGISPNDQNQTYEAILQTLTSDPELFNQEVIISQVEPGSLWLPKIHPNTLLVPPAFLYTNASRSTALLEVQTISKFQHLPGSVAWTLYYEFETVKNYPIAAGTDYRTPNYCHLSYQGAWPLGSYKLVVELRTLLGKHPISKSTTSWILNTKEQQLTLGYAYGTLPLCLY